MGCDGFVSLRAVFFGLVLGLVAFGRLRFIARDFGEGLSEHNLVTGFEHQVFSFHINVVPGFEFNANFTVVVELASRDFRSNEDDAANSDLFSVAVIGLYDGRILPGCC